MQNRREQRSQEERVALMKEELDDMSDAVLSGTVSDAVGLGYRSRAIKILKEFIPLRVDHEIIGKFLEAAARTAGFPYTPGAGADRLDVKSLATEITSGQPGQPADGDRSLAEAIVAKGASTES